MIYNMEKDDEQYIFCLHILEGINFNNRNHAILIVASLCSSQLESEIIEFTDNNTERLNFNNNLIFETSKKLLKRIKSENLPIKVECYSIIRKNKQETRNLIGQILLPVRGVPINTYKKIIQGKPHWHKLFGLSGDWRNKKPELLLYLTITNKQNFIQDSYISCVAEKDDNPSNDNIEKNTANMLKSQKGLYVKLLVDEGLLQVGDSNKDSDIFIVKLTLKHAAHLEYIVKREETMNKLFSLRYNLFGSPIHCKLLPKGDGIHNIQEKVAINFRSSLRCLREYFNNVLYIPIDLYYNDAIIGHATFKFENLIENDDLLTFQSLYGDNDNTQQLSGKFSIQPLFDLPPTSTNPYIEYIFTIHYMSTPKIGSYEIIDKSYTAECYDTTINDCDAIEMLEASTIPTATKRSFLDDDNNGTKPLNKEKFNDVQSTHSDSILYITSPKFESYLHRHLKQKRAHLTKSISNNNLSSLIKMNDLPRTFSYNLILQSIRFTRRPDIGIWQISLHHSKSDTQFTIVNFELTKISSNFIEFNNNLELQLYFSTKSDYVSNIIESDTCLLKIYGPRGMYAYAELDNQLLLMSTKNDNINKNSGVILMEDDNGNQIAMAHIYAYLDDIGINFNSQFKKNTNNTSIVETAMKQSQQKTYFNEDLAYKIVEELEQWKEKQQEIYLVELKRKEINHLAQLTAEWKKCKFEQEIQLEEKLTECSKLTDTLEKAYNTIKLNHIEQTEFLEKIRAEFEQEYSLKIIELNEKYRRLENDTQYQLKLEQLKYMELETNKDHLEIENMKLKNNIDELKQNIIDMEKTYLPRELLHELFQDVRILSDRLKEVQESKDFYKNQWAKIIREVHKMKSDELHKIELNLKQTASLGLEEFLKDEQNELLSEINELNFVKSVLESNEDFFTEDTNEEKQQQKNMNDPPLIM